jgi:hypothetical protein
VIVDWCWLALAVALCTLLQQEALLGILPQLMLRVCAVLLGCHLIRVGLVVALLACHVTNEASVGNLSSTS